MVSYWLDWSIQKLLSFSYLLHLLQTASRNTTALYTKAPFLKINVQIHTLYTSDGDMRWLKVNIQECDVTQQCIT